MVSFQSSREVKDREKIRVFLHLISDTRMDSAVNQIIYSFNVDIFTNFPSNTLKRSQSGVSSKTQRCKEGHGKYI